jgi:hypothetical protein
VGWEKSGCCVRPCSENIFFCFEENTCATAESSGRMVFAVATLEVSWVRTVSAETMVNTSLN